MQVFPNIIIMTEKLKLPFITKEPNFLCLANYTFYVIIMEALSKAIAAKPRALIYFYRAIIATFTKS